LLDEHRRRLGDPVPGGTYRAPIMTAYRQQALACAASLSRGPRRMSEIKSAIPDAPKILLRNVYGWFLRVERGTYALTPAGTAALSRWPQADAYLWNGDSERFSGEDFPATHAHMARAKEKAPTSGA